MSERVLTEAEARAILDSNVGFQHPDRWVQFAINNRFQFVKASAVPHCPDCGAGPRAELGQFVHYSTLMRLRECPACGLVWADARLPSEVVQAHFELAYKGATYFDQERRAIFDHLIRVIAAAAPQGGTVLDIGGAEGHLLHALGKLRPDLRLVVQDLSLSATQYADKHFGLETLCGDVTVLEDLPFKCDVVVFSDVLYYEPRIRKVWDVLPRLLCRPGRIVLRLPNRLGLIRGSSMLARALFTPNRRAMATSIPFFNPEHLFIFGRRYLIQRLRLLGFEKIAVLPSPLLVPRHFLRGSLASALYLISIPVGRLTGGRIIITPGMVLTADIRFRSC